VCAAHAIKLCQLDWFAAWQSKSGALSNNAASYTSNYGSQAESGTWTVTSDEGSPSVQHAVSGISQCTDDTGTTTTEENPWPSKNLADNKNCWCRMTAPNLGTSWVFVYVISTSIPGAAPVPYCASYCAYHCAACVRKGSEFSCSRSDVLTLP
jgi:hypothetical protein